MRSIAALVTALMLAQSPAQASNDAGTAQLVTTFKFAVKYGTGPGAVTVRYDDNTSTSANIGLPDSFHGISCTRAPVTLDGVSKAGGYTCVINGFTAKLAVVFCNTTWVTEQSTTATLTSQEGVSVSLATQCKTGLAYIGGRQ